MAHSPFSEPTDPAIAESIEAVALGAADDYEDGSEADWATAPGTQAGTDPNQGRKARSADHR